MLTKILFSFNIMKFGFFVYSFLKTTSVIKIECFTVSKYNERHLKYSSNICDVSTECIHSY